MNECLISLVERGGDGNSTYHVFRSGAVCVCLVVVVVASVGLESLMASLSSRCPLDWTVDCHLELQWFKVGQSQEQERKAVGDILPPG